MRIATREDFDASYYSEAIMRGEDVDQESLPGLAEDTIANGCCFMNMGAVPTSHCQNCLQEPMAMIFKRGQNNLVIAVLEKLLSKSVIILDEERHKLTIFTLSTHPVARVHFRLSA